MGVNQKAAIEALQRACKEKTSAVHSLHVPELEGVPGIEEGMIYIKPMTLREQGQILKTMDRDPAEAVVETLILRALDSDGNRIFSKNQKSEFMGRRGMVKLVTGIVEQMNEIDELWDPPEEEGAPSGN